MMTARRSVVYGVLAGFMMFASAAAAQVYSGRDLLRACTTPADAAEANTCQGWIDWAFSSPYFCLPEDIDDAAVREVIVQFLQNNPGRLHMPGGALMQNAVYAQWPCAREPWH